ncbi:hypothetical protein MaudCBS49596_001380 [Microsporum audouinii]
MPPDRRLLDPLLNWPIPIVTRQTGPALEEADHLQRLRYMATGQPVRSMMDMTSSLNQALNQPGILSPLNDPYSIHFHNGLPVPDTRNRANPQVTRGYLLPLSSRQENSGLNSHNASNSNNNSSNQQHQQHQQGGDQDGSTGASSPFLDSYPMSGFTSPQQDHTHPSEDNQFGFPHAGSQAPARPGYNAYMHQGHITVGPSEYPMELSPPIHQAQLQNIPWIHNSNTENDLNHTSLPTTSSATDPLSSVQTSTHGSHPPVPSVATPPSLLQRRRSAHVMSLENLDLPAREYRVGSDGVTRRRVRMRPLRVSPASSSTRQPETSSRQPQPPTSTASSATTNRTTSPPAPPPARPSYGEGYLTNLTADTYMDTINRTMETTDYPNRVYLTRQEREARRRMIAEDLLRPKETGLDTKLDARPEPKDSESLVINMECKARDDAEAAGVVPDMS